MKLRIVTIIGVVLVLCGCTLLGYWKYTEIKYKQIYSDTAGDNTLTEDEFTKMLKESREGFEEAEDSDVDEYIEFTMLDDDQKVEKVALYQNVLEIPQLDILAYIGNDTEKETLKRGVGWHNNTAEPGMLGNCVIPGHSSSIYDCIFNNLHNIGILDTFIIWDKAGIKHVYYVTNKYVTDPYDTAILNKTVNGKSQTILYTCTDHGTRRLVVIGQEMDDYDLNKFKAELDKEVNYQLASLTTSNTETGLSKFLKSWGKELPVSHIALPLVENEGNLTATHNYLYPTTQQYWFDKKEHIYPTECYVTNFHLNMWKFNTGNDIS